MVGYGDTIAATAVVENLVAAGIKVNIKTKHPEIWEECDILDKTIT
jgi:hypothetical protein